MVVCHPECYEGSLDSTIKHQPKARKGCASFIAPLLDTRHCHPYIYNMKIKAFIFILMLTGTILHAQTSPMFLIKPDSSGFQLTEKGVSHLASLPLKCIEQQFPNKTSHTSNSDSDHVLLPQQLHPAFYGCFDWHSSVHG